MMNTERQLLQDVIGLVNNHPLALLATVDRDGVPHTRWMGTAAMDGIRRIYTLSGARARKVAHISVNPTVSWTFTSPDFNEVVTLQGHATVVESPIVAQGTWDMLARSARNYAMGVLSDDANLQMCSIETIVNRVEIVSPRRKVFHPVEVTIP